MSMTVARYRRTWTPELNVKLVKQVKVLTKKGMSHRDAYRELAPEWGVAPTTLSVRHWRIIQPNTKKVLTVKNVAPKSSLKNPESVLEAIKVIKKLGAKVTLTF